MITDIRLNEESVDILARLCQEYRYGLLFDCECFVVIASENGWPLDKWLEARDRDVNVAVLQMAIKAGIK